MRAFLPHRQMLAIFLLCAGSAFGAAFAAEWSVVSRTGEVRVQTPRQLLEAADLVPGAALAAPFSVHTAGDGDLVIARGEDKLDIGPGSHIEVPEAPAGDDPVTRVQQFLGSVLYQIRHRAKALFEVHTPYLVSVVKGTTFNVLSSTDTTTVALIDGLLQIHTPDGQAEIFLNAGQAAIRSRGERDITVEDQREVSAPVTGPIRIADGGSGASGSPTTVARGTAPNALRPEVDTDTAIDGLALSSDGSVANPALAQARGADLDVNPGGGVSLGETGLTLAGASLGGTALLPVLDIGASELTIGDISIDGDLNSGIVLDDTSIGLEGAAIGPTALTPAVELGGVTLDLGGAVIGPDLALGDVAVGLGGIGIDETALIPPIALGETTLSAGLDGAVIDIGVIEPLEVSLQIDTPLLPELVEETIPVLTDTVTDTLDNTLGDVAGAVTDPVTGLLGVGGLKLF